MIISCFPGSAVMVVLLVFAIAVFFPFFTTARAGPVTALSIISPAFLLILHALLFFTFEHSIEDRKTLFPPLPRVLNPCFKLSKRLLVEVIQVLLRTLFHHHQVRLTQDLEML